ncbi:hypothetical protein [Saccharothrix variisporea]|uniref:Uncharacterized protein n=1 Tax=Saccharothrix variisporea TaxID=543527 RepID=A0A495X4W6_9PSEU|nr:hypothetical protein [Saccharothrix variisporea]RKT68154.1 hypothetical protein DFJ66_1335 [Saccharothrix variisporea]
MLELILSALAGLIIEVVLTVVVLAFAAVVDWFVRRHAVMDEDDIAFTLRQQLDNGAYTIVQGIFDEATGQVTDARRVNANRLDPRLARAHARDDLAVYT